MATKNPPTVVDLLRKIASGRFTRLPLEEFDGELAAYVEKVSNYTERLSTIHDACSVIADLGEDIGGHLQSWMNEDLSSQDRKQARDWLVLRAVEVAGALENLRSVDFDPLPLKDLTDGEEKLYTQADVDKIVQRHTERAQKTQRAYAALLADQKAARRFLGIADLPRHPE